MMLAEEIRSSLFKISGEQEFNTHALEIFRLQYDKNEIYRKWVDGLGIRPETISHYSRIPFLPVSLFKSHSILSAGPGPVQKTFSSSATTGLIPSQHHVIDLSLYEESFTRSFRHFYGDPGQFRFLALLPGYLERQGSSLVYMLDHLIKVTGENGSGFYLHDLKALYEKLCREPFHGTTLLFGASYALLDFAEQFPCALENIIVMETGGMKGRKREMIREELHRYLCRQLHVDKIHSEYGMTELLSQAYSKGEGLFMPPPWMKILIRDINDPLALMPETKAGGVNVIDLANLYSCAFIATQDLGKTYRDGSFEILGRYDDSDVRGCNLLVV
jgi:hypothetical protein